MSVQGRPFQLTFFKCGNGATLVSIQIWVTYISCSLKLELSPCITRGR